MALYRLGDCESLRREQPFGLTIPWLERDISLIIDPCGSEFRVFLNRCPHLGTPLDWLPDQFLTPDGRYFLCATHGARFRRQDGYCVLGPCRGASLQELPCRIEQNAVLVDLSKVGQE